MEKNCYPKYCYTIYYCLSLIMFLFSILPIFIKTDEKQLYKFIWSILMLIMSALMLIGGLSSHHFYEIIDNKVIVKSIIGKKIIEIDLNNANYEVKTLPTYYSWAKIISKKWICIYEKNQNYRRFDKFYLNKKNQHRLLIVFSDKNIVEIEKETLNVLMNYFNNMLI